MFNSYGLFALYLAGTYSPCKLLYKPFVSLLVHNTDTVLVTFSFFLLYRSQRHWGEIYSKQIVEARRNLREKSRHTSSPTSECWDGQPSPPQVLQLHQPHVSGLTVLTGKDSERKWGRKTREKGWNGTLRSSFTMQNQHFKRPDICFPTSVDSYKKQEEQEEMSKYNIPNVTC